MDTPDLTILKRCSTCHQWKSHDKFGKNKHAKDGLQNQCRHCRVVSSDRTRDERREYKQKYNATNRELVAEGKRRYYAKNADRLKAIQREYRTANAESIAQRKHEYYLENIARIAEYRAANAHKISEKGRKYREQNKEHLREKQRELRRSPKGIIAHRADSHRRRARSMETGGTYTAADIEKIKSSQTNNRGRLICWWCEKPISGKYHIDHRIPLARGGSNNPGNLVLSCPECNLSKHTKLPHEWNGRLL